MNDKNYGAALDRLVALDKKFKLKKKAIIETGATSDFVQEFSQAGWHTSYYLPTETIKDLIKKELADDLRKYARKFAAQATTQKLSAYSFDRALYPFVKDYLEPLLDQPLPYHVWMGPDLDDSGYIEELKELDVYLDERVKTILCYYYSPFHL